MAPLQLSKLGARTSLVLLLSVLFSLGQSQTQVISSPRGFMKGIESETKGVFRYSFPYAKAPVGSMRWQDPQAIGSWNGIYDATNMPPRCPQSYLDPSQAMSEDCLFLTVYTPQDVVRNASHPMPVFVWVHGGSFIIGGATGYGLDGSALAAKSKMVVVVVQYRLGLLGFLRKPGTDSRSSLSGNYAVKDLIMALSHIKLVASAFGGDRSSVTLAGQSSGADMIKTLLATRSASGLFDKAILHSAPLNYGDHSVKTATRIANIAIPLFGCSNPDCLRTTLKVETILEVQSALQDTLPKMVPEIAASVPLRPVVDNDLIQSDFIQALSSPRSGGLYIANRKIIFTTVADEAGPSIADAVGQFATPAIFPFAVQNALGTRDPERYSVIEASQIYSRELGLRILSKHNLAQATLEELSAFGTDYIWRCANQQVAVNLTAKFAPTNRQKGSIWLAEFRRGIPYTTTRSVSFCRGRVCHEDDILALFGTPKDDDTKLSFRQRQLIAEVGLRWAAFAASGSPNVKGYANWSAVSNAHVLNILNLGEGFSSVVSPFQRPWACGAISGLWGTKVPFDAQLPP